MSESSISPRKGPAQFRPLKPPFESRLPGELEQKRNVKKTLSMKPTNKVSDHQDPDSQQPISNRLTQPQFQRFFV